MLGYAQKTYRVSRVFHLISGFVTRVFPVLLLLLPQAGTPLPALAQSGRAVPSAPSTAALAASPRLAFEENRGQADARFPFIAHGPGYAVSIRPDAALLTWDTPVAPVPHSPSSRASARATRSGRHTLRMQIQNADSHTRIVGADLQPGVVRYYRGRVCRSQTPIRTFARLHCSQIYPGIDLEYHGASPAPAAASVAPKVFTPARQQLEYDFLVRPGADPRTISLLFPDARTLREDSHHRLQIHLSTGSVVWQRPVCYQLVGGRRKLIAARYVRRGRRSVGFALAAYDRHSPLVIDPAVAYASYVGGLALPDSLNGITRDAAGNLYVVGLTGAANFPGTNLGTSLPDPNHYKVWAAKLSPAGVPQYTVFLGGSGQDVGSCIAVDSQGNAVIAGSTQSPDFPITADAMQTHYGGGGNNDAFVAKISPTGTLVYSTYYGSFYSESARGVAVDSANNVYVGGYKTLYTYDTRVFVLKIGGDGKQAGYAEIISGGGDYGNGLVLDTAGNVYLTGSTKGGMPITPGAAQTVYGGGNSDAFVAKWSPDLNTLLYLTYLGGNGEDIGRAVAVDSTGCAYVTGTTAGTYIPTPATFPTTSGSLQTQRSAHGNLSNAFVCKLGVSGNLIYSTYLGGDGPDGGYAITVDATGSATVTGITASSYFPVTPDAFQKTPRSDRSNAFLSRLTPGGDALAYSTLLVTSDGIQGLALTQDAQGRAWVGGLTYGSLWLSPDAAQTQIARGFVACVPTVENDFNGDSQSDLIWSNSVTNETTCWFLQGANVSGYGSFAAPGQNALNWQVVGTGDFSRRGQSELVWANSQTNEVQVWYQGGPNQPASGHLVAPGSVSTEYHVVGVADFNGDGLPDLLWQSRLTNRVTVWYMGGPGGATVLGGAEIIGPYLVPPTWSVVATGSFNGDGSTDIVLQDSATNQTQIWLMKQSVITGYADVVAPNVVALSYHIVATLDLDQNGSTDLVWQDSITGAVTIWYMKRTTVLSGTSLPLPASLSSSWHIVGPR